MLRVPVPRPNPVARADFALDLRCRVQKPFVWHRGAAKALAVVKPAAESGAGAGNAARTRS